MKAVWFHNIQYKPKYKGRNFSFISSSVSMFSWFTGSGPLYSYILSEAFSILERNFFQGSNFLFISFREVFNFFQVCMYVYMYLMYLMIWQVIWTLYYVHHKYSNHLSHYIPFTILLTHYSLCSAFYSHDSFIPKVEASISLLFLSILPKSLVPSPLATISLFSVFIVLVLPFICLFIF